MSERPSRPRAPAGLGTEGRRLWRRLTSRYAFEPGELVVLEQAARQADDVAALEAEVAEQGITVTGSRGQPRPNGAVAELRMGRAALSKLIRELRLPTEDDLTPAQRRAQRAAQARWQRQKEA